MKEQKAKKTKIAAAVEAAKAEFVEPTLMESLAAANDALREPMAALNAIKLVIMRKYRLSPNDQIDGATGRIVRHKPEPEQPKP